MSELREIQTFDRIQQDTRKLQPACTPLVEATSSFSYGFQLVKDMLCKAGEKISGAITGSAKHGYASEEFSQDSIGPATPPIVFELEQRAKSPIAKVAAAEELSTDAKKFVDAMNEVVALMKEASEDPEDNFSFEKLQEMFTKSELELQKDKATAAKHEFKQEFDGRKKIIAERHEKIREAVIKAKQTKNWNTFKEVFSFAQAALTVVGAGLNPLSILSLGVTMANSLDSHFDNKFKMMLAEFLGGNDQEAVDKWLGRIQFALAAISLGSSLGSFAKSHGTQGALNWLRGITSAGKGSGDLIGGVVEYQNNVIQANLKETDAAFKKADDRLGKSLKKNQKNISQEFEFNRTQFTWAREDYKTAMFIIKR